MTSADVPLNTGSADTEEVQYLTAPEAAVKLRVSPWQVVMLCREDKLPATKPGKQWLIATTDLDAYIAAGRNAAPESVSA